MKKFKRFIKNLSLVLLFIGAIVLLAYFDEPEPTTDEYINDAMVQREINLNSKGVK